MKTPKFNVSVQDIPYAKEERIQRDVFSLESKRSSLFHRKEDGFMESVKQVEVELCYLQRELEIRKRRRLAHHDYAQKNLKNRSYGQRRYNKNTNNSDNRAKRR
tara:strand:- start:2973 stop:3284 length:312 start_codon:yes stop_codon:yes gene_type:complete